MKFFYDYFEESEVCGVFTLGHFIVIGLFVLCMVIALYLSRNITVKQMKKVHWSIAIITTILETAKITLRVVKGEPMDTWIPLYYCSLFIFAIWLSLCKVKILSRVGYTYICMGGVVASVFFVVCPSTSLAIYPLWHPGVWHSFLYHWGMFYIGVLFLWKKQYVPKKIDALYYFCFIVAACIPSFFINERWGTNCMFLHDAFKLPLFSDLQRVSKWGYMLVMAFLLSVALFWASYGLDALCRRLISRKEEKESAVFIKV